MPNCSNCSAPLPKSGIICKYCGTRNDIDLKSAEKITDSNKEMIHLCPLCHTQMQTIDVGENEAFHIERCSSCYGIFFDNDELESMIENSVKGSRNIDLMKLAKLSEHPRHIDIMVYRKCPVCQETMNRKNFMSKSGVITDVCAKHGVWLDSGELRHILEWVKTGGMKKAKQEPIKKQTKKNKVDMKYAEEKNIDKIDLFDVLEDMFFSIRW